VSSGGAADDAEDLARGRAGERFDARQQVTSEAAYELHCRATADSAVDDHPGFVPDTYLDGLGTGTAALAAELCPAGVWERTEGGYWILDRDAVGRCQDLARQLSGEAARVRARIRARDHARAQLMPEMARAMVVTPPCAACGAPATRIELVAPDQLPARWEHWPHSVRDSFLRHRGPGQWYLIRDGVATSNGYGNPVQAGEAGRIAWAFRPPLRYDRVPRPGFTMTPASVRTATRRTATGTGTCPRPATGAALSGTARAWTRTGNGTKRACCGLLDIKGRYRRTS
jgi:hypothetical protein